MVDGMPDYDVGVGVMSIVAASIMFTGAVVFAFYTSRGVGWGGHPRKGPIPEWNFLACVVNVMTAIFYFIRGLEFLDHHPNTTAFHLAYVDYLVSCPLIVFDLCNSLGAPSMALMHSVATACLLLIAIVANLSEGPVLWAFFTVGCTGFFIFFLSMFRRVREAFRVVPDSAKPSLVWSTVVFFGFWPLFPIFFALFRLEAISAVEQYYAHLLLDLIAKTVFSSFMIRFRLYMEEEAFQKDMTYQAALHFLEVSGADATKPITATEWLCRLFQDPLSHDKFEYDEETGTWNLRRSARKQREADRRRAMRAKVHGEPAAAVPAAPINNPMNGSLESLPAFASASGLSMNSMGAHSQPRVPTGMRPSLGAPGPMIDRRTSAKQSRRSKWDAATESESDASSDSSASRRRRKRRSGRRKRRDRKSNRDRRGRRRRNADTSEEEEEEDEKAFATPATPTRPQDAQSVPGDATLEGAHVAVRFGPDRRAQSDGEMPPQPRMSPGRTALAGGPTLPGHVKHLVAVQRLHRAAQDRRAASPIPGPSSGARQQAQQQRAAEVEDDVSRTTAQSSMRRRRRRGEAAEEEVEERTRSEEEEESSEEEDRGRRRGRRGKSSRRRRRRRRRRRDSSSEEEEEEEEAMGNGGTVGQLTPGSMAGSVAGQLTPMQMQQMLQWQQMQQSQHQMMMRQMGMQQHGQSPGQQLHQYAPMAQPQFGGAQPDLSVSSASQSAFPVPEARARAAPSPSMIVNEANRRLQEKVPKLAPVREDGDAIYSSAQSVTSDGR